jgi:hypothetical protein
MQVTASRETKEQGRVVPRLMSTWNSVTFPRAFFEKTNAFPSGGPSRRDVESTAVVVGHWAQGRPVGQFVRRNDLAFMELKNGGNETVGRTHAHIAMQKDGRYTPINSRHTDTPPPRSFEMASRFR